MSSTSRRWASAGFSDTTRSRSRSGTAGYSNQAISGLCLGGSYNQAFNSGVCVGGKSNVASGPVVLTSYMAPNANAIAERLVLSIKSECLERMIFFGHLRFRRAVGEYIAHYNRERHHQGIAAVPVPREQGARLGRVRSHERLGGLLRHYSRRAA